MLAQRLNKKKKEGGGKEKRTGENVVSLSLSLRTHCMCQYLIWTWRVQQENPTRTDSDVIGGFCRWLVFSVRTARVRSN